MLVEPGIDIKTIPIHRTALVLWHLALLLPYMTHTPGREIQNCYSLLTTEVHWLQFGNQYLLGGLMEDPGSVIWHLNLAIEITLFSNFQWRL